MRRQVYHQRRRNVRSALVFVLAAVLLTGLLVRTDRAVRPNLCAVCESETKRFGTKVMADSVTQVLGEETVSYEDFAELLYDSSGNVTAVETHADQINQLQAALLTAVQQNLDDCRDAFLEVSLGTASGIWIFAEHENGAVKPVVFELLAKAQELKAHNGENIAAVLLGANVAGLAP